MTITVIDGDFPREVVGVQNLIFGEYRMLDGPGDRDGGGRLGAAGIAAAERGAPDTRRAVRSGRLRAASSSQSPALTKS
jgi:hypothetical protein